MKSLSKIVYPELSYKINGILFQTHNQLGRYCNEKQYADLIESFLVSSKISFGREKYLPPSFPGEKPMRNKVDFIIDQKVILEVKARRFITRDDYYQVKRYLEALNKKLGIIVNFREKFIRPKRILNSSVSE